MNKKVLSLLVGMLSTPLFAQNVVVFGDSLSDIGQNGWNHKASYYQNGKANDLYNELLAQKLGSTLKSSTQGGTNYAYSGGVVVAENSAYFARQPNVAVQNQINQYLSQGVKAVDLHILWAGGNDMAAILAKALASADPVGTVVSESSKTAQGLAQQWAMLRQAGVDTIVAPTVPNVVYTPSLFNQFASAFSNRLKEQAMQVVPEEQADELVKAFKQSFKHHSQQLSKSAQHSLADFEQARLEVLKNSVATLYQAQPALSALLPQEQSTQLIIKKYQETATQAAQATTLLNDLTTHALNRVGGNVVRLDIDALFKDMLSHPQEYGLHNTVGTACESTTQAQCSPTVANPQGFLFADGFHPNTTAHQVMADYIYSSLHSPKDLMVLTKLADQLAENSQRVAVTESNQNRFIRQPERSVKTISVYEQQKDGKGIHLGFKAQFTPNWQFSAVLSHQDQDAKQGLISVEAKAKGINTTLRYDAEKWWLGANLGLSATKYTLQRDVKLGQRWHSQNAETSGAVISAKAFGGYEFNWDKHILAAIGEATYSQRKFAAFGEQKRGATQMQFDLAKANQLTTSFGAEYRYQFATFQPYLSARWVKAWLKPENMLQVGLNNSQYTVVLANEDRQWLNLQAGVQWQPTQFPLHIYTQISQDVGRGGAFNKPKFNLGFNYQF